MKKKCRASLKLILVIMFVVTVQHLAVKESAAFLTDSASHPPPSSGTYIYSPPGTFWPNNSPFPGAGGSYLDPVFNETVKRLTDTYSGGWAEMVYMITKISADSTYYIYTDINGWTFVHNMSDTSQVAGTGQEDFGGAGGGYGQFSLNDDDIIYYITGSNLRQYEVSTDTHSTIKGFGASLDNGGSLNFSARVQAASGATSGGDRYFLGTTSSALRFYDAQEDVFYSNQPSRCSGFDFTTIAPDGSGAICAGSGVWWYPVDHATNTWGSSTKLWNGGSPHSDLVSASDGVTYYVVPEGAGLDTTPCGAIDDPQSNTIKIALPAYGESGCTASTLLTHGSGRSGAGMGRARPPNQDWFLNINYVNETSFPASPWNSWNAFKNEVLLINVLTGDVRRLAHHRSRVLNWDYLAQPHGGISPDGQYVIFDSNMGRTAGSYKDVYFVTTGTPSPPSPPQESTNSGIASIYF